MNISVVRERFTKLSTIGRLYVDNVFCCYVLEDCDRHLENGGVKLYGETAIPLGSYIVKMTMSARFGKVLPQLMNVPQFEGIRIHAGNTDADTHGCLLLGMSANVDKVAGSRKACELLFQKIEAALKLGNTVTIKIERK
jgi:hypothetical protein